jgi:hypothetical protein
MKGFLGNFPLFPLAPLSNFLKRYFSFRKEGKNVALTNFDQFSQVWFDFLTKIRANPNQIIELKNFSNPNQIFEYFGFDLIYDFFKSNTLPTKSTYAHSPKWCSGQTLSMHISVALSIPCVVRVYSMNCTGSPSLSPIWLLSEVSWLEPKHEYPHIYNDNEFVRECGLSSSVGRAWDS